MGAWGPAIFSDDLACDIRNDFKDLIAEGLSSDEATKKLLESYSIIKGDREEYNVFWLSLAATQWKAGRLTEEIKVKAIEIVDNGTDLERWYQEGEHTWAKQREKHLLKLKEQLLSPQPFPQKIKKRFISHTNLEVGDAISYQLLSGNYIIIRVIGHHSDAGGTSPVCELCDWMGKEVPQSKDIEKLPTLKEKNGASPNRVYSKFILGQLSNKDYPNKRTKLVAKALNIKANERGGGWVFLWKTLDKQLEELYRLS